MKNGAAEAHQWAALHFELPERLIARFPTERREDSRLLVVRPAADRLPSMEHRRFFELPAILTPGDLLIFNNSKVSFRRMDLRRRSGGRIEALLLSAAKDGLWTALLRGRKRLKPGELLECEDAQAPVVFRYEGESGPGEAQSLLFPLQKADPERRAWRDAGESEAFFERFGSPPLPPYLSRKPEEIDRLRYQTVFADRPGSVAAPTAGLHFSAALLERLAAAGVARTEIRLDIGYGTFAPVSKEMLDAGKLHPEHVRIEPDFAAACAAARGRRIAIGTTSLRAVESWHRRGRRTPDDFDTTLFLRPPDRVESVDALLTNFHLPGSTLLLLIACALGPAATRFVYQTAIDQEYRFFSYGDAMLILPPLL